MRLDKAELLAILRISLGFVFLWVFLDKSFGLNFATAPEQAWIAGNSPTAGFLNYGTKGPLVELFQSLSGNLLVDWLFMLGMLGVGSALILGIGMQLAALAGSLQMLLIYLSMFPPENNPIIDEHIIYVLVLWLLVSHKAGNAYGVGGWWQKQKIVKNNPWLR